MHKKESKFICSNYRPISLLSNLDKILEKLKYSRAYDFLDKDSLLYSLQFGFCQQYWTSHALLHMIEKTMKALDDGNFEWGIFTDLQKAFHTVDHNIILGKLSHYGIRGVANKWFESHLSEWKHFLSINGFDSDMSTIASGVLQSLC